MKKKSKTEKDLVVYEGLFGRDENWSQVPGIPSQCCINVIFLFSLDVETAVWSLRGGAALTSVIWK